MIICQILPMICVGCILDGKVGNKVNNEEGCIVGLVWDGQ